MTPSKSKTTALITVERRDGGSGGEGRSAGPRRSSLRGLVALARPDRHLQPVLRRRNRALVGGTVVAVREVRPVEVHFVDAGRIPIQIKITAAGIGLGAAGQIVERDEQVVDIRRTDLDKRGELQRLAFQAE